MKSKRHILVICLCCIAMLVGSLILSILSLWFYPLTTFTHNSEDFEHSSFSCLDCPSQYDGTSYSCLSVIACKSEDPVLCEIGKDLSKARWSLFVSEIVHIAFVLLSLERIISLCFKKYFGRKTIIPLLGIAQFLTKTVGIVLFTVLGNIDLGWNCDDLCLSSGGKVLQVNVIMSAIYAVCSVLVCKLSRSNKPVLIEGVRNMYVKVFLMLMVYLLFWVLSLCYNWVSYETSEYHSGTVNVYNDLEEYGDVEYSCGAAIYRSEDTKREQEALSNLKDASEFYLKCSIPGAILLVLWIEHSYFLAKNEVFGVQLGMPVVSLLSFGLLLCGFVGWMLYSNTQFKGCKIEKADDAISFCVENGLIFGMISIAILFVTLVFYICLWSQINKYKIIEVENEGPKTQEAAKNSTTISIISSNTPDKEFKMFHKNIDLEQTEQSSNIPSKSHIQFEITN